ncbi:MAG: RHS repeat-associated core domain-containing protein [Myxococcus sp.]|nr:RHS repeat-associated core domain-containing protein [Myxococcus sp.]
MTGRVDAFREQIRSLARSRPANRDLHPGAFHLVSNQQNFVMLALSDYDGKVASFALPDADGQINRPRFVHFGDYGSGHAQTFDVPSTFSKQARFRTVYTGGWNTDYWGPWGGITEMRLTVGASSTGITPNGAELGRVVGPWSPTTRGTQNVTWSTVCSSNCASATDMLEWRVWETGAPRFNTRLRFPGQYHDAETDFFENCNRFYDPTTGRYLSPEPLLENPAFVAARLRRGGMLPPYAYASNNPIGRVDRDGRLDGWALIYQAAQWLRGAGSSVGGAVAGGAASAGVSVALWASPVADGTRPYTRGPTAAPSPSPSPSAGPVCAPAGSGGGISDSDCHGHYDRCMDAHEANGFPSVTNCRLSTLVQNERRLAVDSGGRSQQSLSLRLHQPWLPA